MSAEHKLIPIDYYDPKSEVRLSVYADTIIFEPENKKKILRAIRFGGYPEMVRAMADAIYGGAGIDAEVNGQMLHLQSQPKRYQRQLSHDGVYAEATLICLDDAQDVTDAAKEDAAQSEKKCPPRKCFIFCPQDNTERLFEELDRKTSIPLIPAFRDYVLEELQTRGILQKLTVISLKEKLDAWVMCGQKDDANIAAVVEDGLKSGQIAIPGEVHAPAGFDAVDNVTGYLNAFGVTVAQRIRNQFQPLFDPSAEILSPEILEINDYIREKAGYSLYNAQLAVAESVKRQLSHAKCAFIVAECGSGKSKIGATAMAAAFARRKTPQAQQAAKTFNVILCPSHVSKKWVRELGETLPNTMGMVVRSITDLNRLYGLYEKSDKSVYAVISKERARDGYMKKPAVLWNRRQQAFLCPDCMEVLEMPGSDEGVSYMVYADQFWFRTEHSRNHKCPCCGTSLWTAVNPACKSDWVKIGGYGWVYRYRANEHLEKCKNEAVWERLREISENPDGHYPTLGACRRYPLSSYLKRRFRGKLDGAICDELHQYNNASGQGDAMGEIYNAARKVIGMTATLINGYSSGIFHLLYRVVPHLMRKDGKPYDAPRIFDAEYGVVESTYEVKDADYASNRRNQKVKKQTRQLPGVSPLVYSRFLLEHAAFLSLSDMGKELPDYEEIPVPLAITSEVEKEYKHIEKALIHVLRTDRRAAKKILSAYLNLLTVFPDQPYSQPEILHPGTGDPIVTPKDITGPDTLGAKEEAALEIVRRKIENGEHVLIYTSWVRTDSQQKLLNLLTDNGYRVDILTGKISPDKREEWVEKRVQNGLQVLITNPSLVETGLDLNAFTTIIFYSLGYNLFTLRQASRRSWRINQTAPRVEVYLFYYQGTMQHKAIKLMASKLAVAGIIEGSFTEEGLAAMSDVQDMTSQLAKELMLGIRDNVEDIAASFKKMAILNPDRAPCVVTQPDPVIEIAAQAASRPMLPIPKMMPAPNTPLAVMAPQPKQKKQSQPDENQLSFFAEVA